MVVPPRLQRSQHLSWFAHMGAVYLFHDLYGYLMEMSPDIADLIEAFAGGADTTATLERFATRFEGTDPGERSESAPLQSGPGPAGFIDVLVAHAVLIEPGDVETDMIRAFVPIKGKWNIWQRRGERLCLWTAWGDRPVTQILLDPEETAMWDAFDGEKRVAELKLSHDQAKLTALVQRLTHSDVQALKLSMMPWSTYAKRPGMAPPYLASTMPYAAWQPGAPVPEPVVLTDYYRDDVVEAEAQFDHQETTLSHLLRVPHPALADRTYGQALIDALIARDAIPTGVVRVLEIGAGLGYVARDAIARLRAAGRTVAYSIIELAPALATAQRKLLGGSATWTFGDALEVEVPDASFDLVICNEMVGDLPAKQLSRLDLGLSIDGRDLRPAGSAAEGRRGSIDGGVVDRDRLRVYSAVAADLGVVLDDAPEPFYLQTGAIELVSRIARWLAPGGTSVITEFGDTNAYPKLSSHLDHPELSTHFGMLLQVARGSGLAGTIEFVIDLLDFDRDQKGLATTRSQFRALRALAADAGVDLPKIGFTPALLEHTVAGKLDLATVGDLRWERIEDRLMGLVPHEFRALVVSKPS